MCILARREKVELEWVKEEMPGEKRGETYRDVTHDPVSRRLLLTCAPLRMMQLQPDEHYCIWNPTTGAVVETGVCLCLSINHADNFGLTVYRPKSATRERR